MSAWPHDEMSSLIAFYGDPRAGEQPSKEWMVANLVAVTPPWRMVLSWNAAAPLKSFQFHKKAAPALARVLADIWQQVGKSQAAIEKADLHLFGGAFSYRPIRGSQRLSCHGFGCAIDLDPVDNPMGKPRGDLPQFALDAFAREGATWGGRFVHRPDPMHFQFADI